MNFTPPRRILIIEDDDDIRESLTEILESEGYEVQGARNGLEGIECLRSGELPHLIFLDLMMPVKDGFGFREDQRRTPEWANIPIVVMSADGNVKQKFELIQGKQYLKKPVDLDAVLIAASRYASERITE